MQRPHYGIVGRGRVATHIARYLQLESQDYCTWHRDDSAAPEEALGTATTLLLAISDDALEPFLQANPGLGDKTLVHFSGCKTLQGVTGLHPLTTFGPEPYDLDTYRAIPFVAEEGSAGFSDIFPALENPSWSIPADQKPLYHALCVMAGNFPTLLWAKTIADFENRLGLPREILGPYLRQTLNNTLGSGSTALTGPLARGDRETARRNLAALDDERFADIYRAFARGHGMQEI